MMENFYDNFLSLSPPYQIVRCHYLCLPLIDSKVSLSRAFAKREGNFSSTNVSTIAFRENEEKFFFSSFPRCTSLSTNSPSSINQFQCLMKRREGKKAIIYFYLLASTASALVYLYALSHTHFLSLSRTTVPSRYSDNNGSRAHAMLGSDEFLIKFLAATSEKFHIAKGKNLMKISLLLYLQFRRAWTGLLKSTLLVGHKCIRSESLFFNRFKTSDIKCR